MAAGLYPDPSTARMLPDVAAILALSMKRVVVHLKDQHGHAFVAQTEYLEDAEAEEERTRIEQEHAAAGAENRWIRVGADESIQSKHIQWIRLETQDEGPVEQWGGSSFSDMD